MFAVRFPCSRRQASLAVLKPALQAALTVFTEAIASQAHGASGATADALAFAVARNELEGTWPTSAATASVASSA